METHDIMITTSEGFEGYEIVEYLGFVNGQIAIGSNIFQNVANATSKESVTFTNKLQQTSEKAMEDLCKSAKKMGANAVIGVNLNYTELSSNATGAVAFGTAVVIREKDDRVKKIIAEDLYVTNYYTAPDMPRPTRVSLRAQDGIVKISAEFFNYNQHDIEAIRADVEVINYYDERFVLEGLDFTFEKNNLTQLESVYTECKLPVKYVKMIKDAKIRINKYVSDKKVVINTAKSFDVTINRVAFEGAKAKYGADAFEKYRANEHTWTCVCGCINPLKEEKCTLCEREAKDQYKTYNFDYDEMMRRLKVKANVTEQKNVLMEYIKDIDNKYRMELLETMESALQYEKTRGDMTGTVVEKIEKILEV